MKNHLFELIDAENWHLPKIAPLPTRAQDILRARIEKFNASGHLKWEQNSPARAVGLWAIDFLACRHFRTPVPTSMWYQIMPFLPSLSAPPAGK